jgi:hypothetical protein
MDVHYLPSNRHIKSAKEYILDFLIMFLAVILGFIANDARQSHIEKTKAKEYARLLYDDLKSDQSAIQLTFNDKEWIESKYDSVEAVLATKDIRGSNEFIYYVERYLAKNQKFTSQDITYQQSRYNGNEPVIKNLKLNKNIATYYRLYSQYRAAESSYETSGKNDLSEIESRLFNPSDLSGLDNNKAIDYKSLVLYPSVELRPIRRDIEYLKFFYIRVDNAKKQANSSKLLLKDLKLRGTNIMTDLKKGFALD